MPRPPAVNQIVTSMHGGVFSRLADRIQALEGEIYPLHVGDTWLEPPPGAHMQDLRTSDHRGLHRYSAPMGHPALLEALADLRGVDPRRILVTAGATGGLGAVAGATLDPGDEVLVLAPYWPLIAGIVRTARGVPVEVPFYGEAGTVAERLAPLLTERTVAVYLNSPNNPTGAVLSREELTELAAFARAHGLWVWADEVYEPFAYARPWVPIADLAPERTFSAYSFSKAWGMAGNRVGYVVGPADPDLAQQLRKVSLHAFYAAPTASQLAALRVLTDGQAWLADARARYHAAGVAAADRLGLPHPEGGTFLFPDVTAHLDEDGLHGFLVRCIDRNLVLAPGTACGAAYTGHVRVCFTSAPPDVVGRGIDVLAELLGR